MSATLTTNAAVVRCRGITKDFRSGERMHRVLHAIDLEIPGGEITMLVGPSGCGKTTLISIIAGILTPTAGEVFVGDTDLTHLPDRSKVQFRGAHVGFIFQQYNLLPALTAAENAALPLIANGATWDRALQQTHAVLARLGMEDHAEKRPNQLSGGQQQRVAVARALVHQPRLVVCDEPTAALDAASGRAVMRLLREIAVEPDRAVLVVTHDNRIFEFADQIAYMNDGRIDRIERTTPAKAAALEES